MTLGNWILQKAETAQDKCANKLCTLPNVAHYEVLVHRETRLQVAMELHSGFKARDPDQIVSKHRRPLSDSSRDARADLTVHPDRFLVVIDNLVVSATSSSAPARCFLADLTDNFASAPVQVLHALQRVDGALVLV